MTTSRTDRHTQGEPLLAHRVDSARCSAQQGERSTAGIAADAPLSSEVRALANACACPSCGTAAGALVRVRTKVSDDAQRQESLYLRCRSCRAKFKPAELRALISSASE